MCAENVSAEEKGKRFELRVYYALQEQRVKLVNLFPIELKTLFKLPVKIGSDIHFTNFVKKIFSLALIPMSQNTLSQYGLWSYYFWWIFNKSLMLDFNFYKPYQQIMNDRTFKEKEISLQERTDFIRRKIDQNPNLTPEQRGEVFAQLSLITNENIYTRLTFIFLGVLKLKSKEPSVISKA